LLLSFGEAKERRERPDHSARFALPQKLFDVIIKLKKNEKRFCRSVALLQLFNTVAQQLHQGNPKSGVHRFRAPFLCSFLLEKQKKGEKTNHQCIHFCLFDSFCTSKKEQYLFWRSKRKEKNDLLTVISASSSAQTDSAS
jgi:hypothetical protein